MIRNVAAHRSFRRGTAPAWQTRISHGQVAELQWNVEGVGFVRVCAVGSLRLEGRSSPDELRYSGQVMQFEMVDSAFQVDLFGFQGSTAGKGVRVVGKQLMDAMWREVQGQCLKTKGINHWVYLPNAELFTGVELADGTANRAGKLDPLAVSLTRYLRYVHIGLYSALPEIWPQLLKRLKEQGETPLFPHLEIYGHWNNDPIKCETTILIGCGGPMDVQSRR